MEVSKKKLLEKIEAQFSCLLLEAKGFGEGNYSMQETELGLLKQLLSMGLQLLIYTVLIRCEKIAKEFPANIKEYQKKGYAKRCYGSIFGEFEISRLKYYQSGKGSVYPLDLSMKLPKSKWSYLLQNWIGRSATVQDYRQSVHIVNEILGLGFSGDDSKRICEDLSTSVSVYYEEKKQVIPAVGEGNMLAVGWDGKGVPMIMESMLVAEDSPQKGKRLKKGEKRGVKKMATVSINAEFKPIVRDTDTIIRGLFKKMKPLEKQFDKDSNSSKPVCKKVSSSWYENIHRRAFLSNQQKAIDYGLTQLKSRITGNYQPHIIALVDGGTGLEQNIRDSFEREGMSHRLRHIIIDIIHVEEYVWKAANAILGECSVIRTQWVETAMRDILDGKVSKLITDLQSNRDKTSLSKNQKEVLKTVIRYFSNHQHKMQYHIYLAQGLPISTAIVESTCKHLVKDRMEGSGMRWNSEGAQQMMDLRAVYINKNWNDFMTFVEKQNNLKRNKWAA